MSDTIDRRVWVIAAACTCGPLMSGLDATMVNVSLDTIGRAFHAPLGTIQWVMPIMIGQMLGPSLGGLLLAPMGLEVFFALPIMGRLSERYGARMISGGGAAIALVGTLPFACGGADMPLALLAVALLVRGFGVGSITLPSAGAAYAWVPRESLGHATTAINICQRFGGPVGTTGLAIFLQHALANTAIPAIAYTGTFWLPAGLAAAGSLAASQLPGARSRA